MGFFDKISEKATEVYNTTAEKTNQITREMKLKSGINENKNKIERIYQEIGKIIYDKYKMGEVINAEQDFSEQVYQIDLYVEENEKAQAEIRLLKKLRLCENCEKEISLTARFCPFCGKEQKENNNQENNNTKQEKSEEQVRATDTSKREPGIILSNTILDIEEPEIIVEEIGKEQSEE